MTRMSQHTHGAPPAKPRPRAGRLIGRFIEACGTGDAASIAVLLHRDIELTVDSGENGDGPHRADGPEEVARAIVSLLRRYPGCRLHGGHVNGRPGILVLAGDRVVGVISAVRAGRRMRQLWIVVNPDKLRSWNTI